jgi:hypothetical protein
MSFFKKLFGKLKSGNTKYMDEKFDIKSLIASKDINNSIIELDNYICKLCNFGDNLELLTNAQQIFYFNQSLEREINNGGFNLFYLNHSGYFAHETVDSLKAIGAYLTAEIVINANNQFPKGKVPKDYDERQNVLSKIDDKSNEIWDELDQKFYKYENDLNSLNIEYVKNNKNEF